MLNEHEEKLEEFQADFKRRFKYVKSTVAYFVNLHKFDIIHDEFPISEVRIENAAEGLELRKIQALQMQHKITSISEIRKQVQNQNIYIRRNLIAANLIFSTANCCEVS